MRTSNLGDITLQALQCLKDSGSKSFEQLTANLLSSLIGVPIRLCKSGEQGGIDALAEIPIAVEAKRYDGTRLKVIDLKDKLSAAARSYPDLQLWVLITTKDLPAQDYTVLKETADESGLGMLVLDKASVQPHLLSVSTVSAFAATNVAVTLQAVSDQEWWDKGKTKNMPPALEVENDLKSIRALPRFFEWESYLRNQLQKLPLWGLVTERQNRRLAKLLNEDAYNSLGTVFDSKKVVSRSVKNQLTEWLTTVIKASEPEVAVVLGERFDGKTWCVFDWLRDQLSDLSLPVFFVGSNRGINSEKSSEDHILDDIKRVLGSAFGRHAKALVQRQRSMEMGLLPWCLVVLDGLNEYYPNVNKCLDHITWAIGQQDLAMRPCAVLATVRKRSWPELNTQVPGQKREIQIESYDDREFRDALQLEGLPENYLMSIPDRARILIRRPRYFGLVSKYKDQLGAYGAVTPDVLHWLDACDKIGRSESTSGLRLDAKGYQEVLKNLGKRYCESGFLNRTDTLDAIGGLAANPRTALAELESEGVLKGDGIGYDIDSDRLAIGMGLWLLEELKIACGKKKNLLETLRDFLSPDQETEEKIAWLRSATVIALLVTPSLPEEMVDVLVDTWLRSRNLSPSDFQKIKALRGRLLQPLLRLAPKTWSSEGGEPRLQELSRLVFVDALDMQKEILSRRVRDWFRLVPAQGSSFLQYREKETEKVVRSSITDSTLADLGLKIDAEEEVAARHKVGLYLVSKAPDLVSVEDLLSLFAAKTLTLDYLGDGEWFAMRRALASIGRTWFEDQVHRLSGDMNSPRRRILHSLIGAAEREELRDLYEATKPTSDFRLERAISPGKLDRARYEAVSAQPFAANENPQMFAELAGEVVCDPSLPKPCEARMTVLRGSVRQTFAKVELASHRSVSLEDVRFERLLPALAAWMPNIGTDIVRQQMISLSVRGTDGRWWALQGREHAVLADGPPRSALAKALANLPQNTPDREIALGYLLLALFPGMSQSERIDALIAHPLGDFEWTDLYEFVASLLDAEGAMYLRRCMQGETDSLRLRRMGHLLGRSRDVELTEHEIENLVSAIAGGDKIDRWVTLRIAVIGEVKNIPVQVLLPLATDLTDAQSLIPAYAASLLVHGDALENALYEDWIVQLPPQWRAEAVVRRVDLSPKFLQEVEFALVAGATSARTPLPAPLEAEVPQGDDPLPSSISLSQDVFSNLTFRQRETPPNDGRGQSDNSSLSLREVVGVNTERLENIQKEVDEELKRRAGSHKTCWSSHQFPQSLMDRLFMVERPRFKKWLSALLKNRDEATHWWGGLLASMFQTLIRAGDSQAKELWSVVFPFQRGKFSFAVQFVSDGIPWVLHELSNLMANDELASFFLSDLILHALSDQELFFIALGARHQEPQRLVAVIEDLLLEQSAEVRSRAVKIAGWLEGMEAKIAEIETSDPSLWVRQVAAEARQSQQLEAWGRHWLTVFLDSKKQTEVRWGAGQLFLACVDSRFQSWAWSMVRQDVSSDRVRGEAILLLSVAQEKAKERGRKLQETFLRHKVNELQAVCDPWLPTIKWE